MSSDLIQLTPKGLYVPAGDVYIDPWPSVADPARQSIITHGHADHARPNSLRYFATPETRRILQARMSPSLDITPLRYGETHRFNDAVISLHSAGHVLGSAQVRVQVGDEVWVASGDYKRAPDPTCAPFEVVPCDAFITEATFALPAYRWRPMPEVAEAIWLWWQTCASKGRTAVLFCYAFGKVQRVLAELLAHTDRAVYLHGAMLELVELYRELGVDMLPTKPVHSADDDFSDALVLAPPSAAGSPWMRRFKQHSTGFASGWMRVRGNRRRRGYDRGFVISDHADWSALVQTVQDCGAKRVLATHGKTDVLVRYLREQGIAAETLAIDAFGSTDGDED